MTSPPKDFLTFGAFEVDLARRELRKDGAALPVEPQVLDLIAFLAANPGRVVSRDEIINAVWNGRIVSDSAVASRINAARTALGDDGKAQRVIRTVPRRGFLFLLEPGTVPDPAPGSDPIPGPDMETESDTVSATVADRPSIAVLPFTNGPEESDLRAFAEGLSDDIVIELVRYSELFVISRTSSFAYRDAERDPHVIAADLGADYILEGSVRRIGAQVRVTALLIDPEKGRHLWAERYDRGLDDPLAVQDEITAMIVNTLVGRLTQAHYRVSLARGTQQIAAHENAMRAMVLLQRFETGDNLAARGAAEAAVAMDPAFSRAHALLSWTYGIEGALLWSPDQGASFARARALALRAVALDDQEPWALAALGFITLYGERAHARALARFDEALSLNPNNAHFRSWYALALCLADRPEDALKEIQHAIRQNPRYPTMYLSFLTRIQFTQRRYEEALQNGERLIAAQPSNSNTRTVVAACHMALGRPDAARAAIKGALAVSPGYRIRDLPHTVPYKNAEFAQHYADLLRQAGMPE